MQAHVKKGIFLARQGVRFEPHGTFPVRKQGMVFGMGEDDVDDLFLDSGERSLIQVFLPGAQIDLADLVSFVAFVHAGVSCSPPAGE